MLEWPADGRVSRFMYHLCYLYRARVAVATRTCRNSGIIWPSPKSNGSMPRGEPKRRTIRAGNVGELENYAWQSPGLNNTSATSSLNPRRSLVSRPQIDRHGATRIPANGQRFAPQSYQDANAASASEAKPSFGGCAQECNCIRLCAFVRPAASLDFAANPRPGLASYIPASLYLTRVTDFGNGTTPATSN